MRDLKLVEVIAMVKATGQVMPLFIVYDEEKYPVKVSRIILAASVFGSRMHGLRYTVSVGRETRYLYLQDDLWYVEKPN